MKKPSSPSLARNTGQTSTFGVLSAYFASARPALRSPMMSAPLPPAEPSTTRPPSEPLVSPASSSPSPTSVSPCDTETASVCERPSYPKDWVPPDWRKLLAGMLLGIIGTWLVIAPPLRSPSSPAATAAPNSASASAPKASVFPLRTRNGYLLTVPNQGTYLLELRNGALQGETSAGMVTLIPTAGEN